MLKSLAEKEGIHLDYQDYDWVAKCQKLFKPLPSTPPPPAIENAEPILR